MTGRLEIYKCEICGNIVEMLHTGKGQLVCCGQPMKLLEAKTEESGYEKHLPVVEKTEKGAKVKVGSVPHPMEEQHYIEWIEVITEAGTLRKFLTAGQTPEVKFETDDTIIQVREFCSIHGLWSKKQ